MKAVRKFTDILFITIVSVIFLHGTVYAAGSVKISGDKTSCDVGDEYKVTVTADNPKDASVAPEISVTYDTRRLEFTDCSVSYGGGGGGLISINETDADITFKVLSGGTAVVDVSAVFDGNGADAKKASVSLEVEGEDTASSGDDASSDDLGIEGGSVMSSDGTKLVSSVFADEFMPAGFYKTSVTFEEQLVEAAQFDMGDILLLYVTDENGNDGNFNIYDEQTGELSDFLQISGIENKFIIVLKDDDLEESVPDGFMLATLQWNGQTLDAYSYDGISDFFLLYAISSEGNKGWYLYDQRDGTYQRYIEELYKGHGAESEINLSDNTVIDPDAENTEENTADDESGNNLGKPDIKIFIIIVLAALALGLLIALIAVLVKLREASGDDNYYPEDDIDNPYDKVFAEKKTEPAISKAAANKITASDIVAREMNSDIKNPNIIKTDIKNPSVSRSEIESIEAEIKKDSAPEMPKTDNIYEKYKAMDEHYKNNPAASAQSQMSAEPAVKVGYDDDYDNEDLLSRDERKALRAEEKARKKAEKKMKKEYGEFGPADFSQWQEVVRDDRRVSEKELKEVSVKPTANEKTQHTPQTQPDKPHINDNKDDISDTKKDSYVKMMQRLPANDKNEPVQPKPVQQFDLDDDFEFEYLNIEDD